MASLEDSKETLGESVTQAFDVVSSLKYGCNPHQQPAAMCSAVGNGLEMPLKVVNGVPGYINLLDAINSWLLVREMDKATGLSAAVSFKHVSPAGAAVTSTELRGNEPCIYEVAPSARDNLSPVALVYIRSRADTAKLATCSHSFNLVVSTVPRDNGYDNLRIHDL
ncbi:bifunctional purine biosynthesis protein, putative [Perkinsus marinus ATCC 50983]|uniref:Bifunctional purine biosynthesis protein, putative n=1 Tax=Perkinsus marinus (strain ATCC 50983 / TXsc) TaxID=423536 RepID=C5KCC2_PERM5|nr:bifunctional purine biosynthesis protein, putative [Perkinsus marinus ATCC 50983]EER17935.1 bifunctional purine biosynthesis protein, putative [Perkinsus marinus ATCC 50983]|eukprot:XP_002786139.1 bifunctional purine biosynthesis protein, putative [Perkinsus marinus ATCC 50983]